jgi:hypothetical protein
MEIDTTPPWNNRGTLLVEQLAQTLLLLYLHGELGKVATSHSNNIPYPKDLAQRSHDRVVQSWLWSWDDIVPGTILH